MTSQYFNNQCDSLIAQQKKGSYPNFLGGGREIDKLNVQTDTVKYLLSSPFTMLSLVHGYSMLSCALIATKVIELKSGLPESKKISLQKHHHWEWRGRGQ